MDTRDLTGPSPDPAAVQVVEGYLSVLQSVLPAGRRARARIVAEIADGLACAAQNHTQRGMSALDAARAAVAEFGDPRALAADFTRQLSRSAAHQAGIGLVLTGPLVGLAWVAAYGTTGVGWQSQIGSVLAAMPQLPFILAITVPAALIAITGAGWPARYVALPSRLVTLAALVAATGCVAGDLSLLSAAIVAGDLTAAGPMGVIAVAAAASVVRLSAAGWAGRRIAKLRGAAN